MTSSPLDRARTRLEAFVEAEAAHRLARLEGRDVTADARALVAARRALGTGENRADLEDARSLGLLDPVTERLVLAHVADAAASEAIARTGVSLDVLGDDVVVFEGREHTILALSEEAVLGPDARTIPRLRAVAERFDRDRAARREAIAAGEEAAVRVRARLAPDGDAALDADRATRFLDATDATLEELAGRARHARGIASPGPAAFFASLRATGARRTSAASVTSLLAPLGLDGPLGRAARLGTHRLASVAVELVVRRDAATRVLSSSVELGLLGRVLCAATASRALVLALGPRGPFELRTEASDATAARAIGWALATSLAEPVVLRRSLGDDERDARRDAVATALALLVVARVLATQLVSLGDRPGDEDARVRGARALGLREPLPTAELADASTLRPSVLHAVTTAILDGLAAPVVLRERFDFDWPRNPRVGDLVRAASQHGPGSLTSGRWLAELGARPEDAEGFGRELADG